MRVNCRGCFSSVCYWKWFLYILTTKYVLFSKSLVVPLSFINLVNTFWIINLCYLNNIIHSIDICSKIYHFYLVLSIHPAIAGPSAAVTLVKYTVHTGSAKQVYALVRPTFLLGSTASSPPATTRQSSRAPATRPALDGWMDGWMDGWLDGYQAANHKWHPLRPPLNQCWQDYLQVYFLLFLFIFFFLKYIEVLDQRVAALCVHQREFRDVLKVIATFGQTWGLKESSQYFQCICGKEECLAPQRSLWKVQVTDRY